jgi:hypothetical protein
MPKGYKKGEEPDIEKIIMLKYKQDPLMFYRFNKAQLKAIECVKEGEPINILTFGNGTGKTFILVAIWSAIMFGTENPVFQGGIFSNWRFPKSARLCAPEPLLSDNGVIQRLMAQLFPEGKYEQLKNKKQYYSFGRTTTGWTWDVMTYDQEATQAVGETKGLILYSEPMPYALFAENMARLRAGGMVICELTPMYYSAWLKDEYIDKKYLTDKEGKILGKVMHVEGSIWDNCVENGGFLTKKQIELLLSRYPDDERELRETGKFGSLIGAIYKNFRKEYHIIDDIPEYHKEEYEKNEYTLYNVVDPHDRRPFAIGWYAVFKNGDIINIYEFPDERYPLHHKIKDFGFTPRDYVNEIKHIEMDIIGKRANYRIIDPNFGNTPTFATNTTIKQELYKCGKEIGYELVYQDPPDDIETGHLLVKEYLGYPEKNIRPKLYFLSRCKNHIFGMEHYCWKEKKGAYKTIDERPELEYKDFPDLVRYLVLCNPKYSEPLKEQILYQKRTIGTYRGA